MIKPLTNQLPQVNAETKPVERDPKLLKAAQMYETKFLEEMVKAMRQTVDESQLIKSSMGEKIFREQLDQQYVDQWVHVKGGVGLSDMIYNQIVDRFGASLGIAGKNVTKPKGPIPLGDNKNIKAKELPKVQPNKNGISMQIQTDGDREVLNPWPGKIVEEFKLDDGKQIAKISHDNGLFSLLSYNGESIDKNSRQLTAGQPIGRLNPGQNLMQWHVHALREV